MTNLRLHGTGSRQHNSSKQLLYLMFQLYWEIKNHVRNSISFNSLIVFSLSIICLKDYFHAEGAISDGLRVGKPGIEYRQRHGIIFSTTISIVTSLGVGRSGVRIPVGISQLSLLQNFQTGSLGPPGFLFNGYRWSLPGRNIHPSPPSSAKV